MPNGDINDPIVPQIPDFLRPPLVDPDFAREIHRELALERERARRDVTIAGLPAIPLDLPPPITPVPFPTGAAANDPIAGFSKIPGLLRLGGGLISAAIIVTDILRLAQEERINVMLIEQDLEIDTILSRAAARKAKEKPVRVDPEIVLVPRLPEIPAPIPEIIVTAPSPSVRPRPAFDPESPVDIPGVPVPEPLPAALPEIPVPSLPQPSPQTDPSISPTPAPARPPARLPRGLPFPAPGRLPAFFPLPFSSPVGSPLPRPIGDNLTRPGPGVQQSPRPGASASFIDLPQPQPQPQTDLDRRCRERQKQKQRKNRCDEGFFRETRSGRTDFKVWRTVNCVTGKTVGEQSGGNVFDIFGGR